MRVYLDDQPIPIATPTTQIRCLNVTSISSFPLPHVTYELDEDDLRLVDSFASSERGVIDRREFAGEYPHDLPLLWVVLKFSVNLFARHRSQTGLVAVI